MTDDHAVGRGRQPVQPYPEEGPGSRLVAGGGQHGATGGLGFSEYRAGRLGDFDYDPAREGRSRLALGQHAQADQGRKTTRLMILDLVGDGHGS